MNNGASYNRVWFVWIFWTLTSPELETSKESLLKDGAYWRPRFMQRKIYSVDWLDTKFERYINSLVSTEPILANPDIPTISTKSYPASPDIGLTIILQQIFDLTMGRGMFRFKTRRTMDILTSTPYCWKVWSRISFVQCSKILSLFQQFPRDLHVPCIPKYQSTLKLRTLWDAHCTNGSVGPYQIAWSMVVVNMGGVSMVRPYRAY